MMTLTSHSANVILKDLTLSLTLCIVAGPRSRAGQSNRLNVVCNGPALRKRRRLCVRIQCIS